MDERRAQGLCFNYDEKFKRDTFVRQSFFALIITNEDTEQQEEKLNSEDIQAEILKNLEINLNALIGQHNPRNLHLQGFIKF